MTATRALDDLWWLDEEEPAIDTPPAVATDERRLQVRAHNRWTGMLRGRTYPSIEDLRDAEGGFGDCAVVLDFSSGPADPTVVHLGTRLRDECELTEAPLTVSDVPSRSLLSRLTDNYLRIIANRAPIGFEAEFVSQRGLNTLYRGILMPCSSDDMTIDYIYGVINWKELADTDMTAELVLEMDRALSAPDHARPPWPRAVPDAPDALDAARRAKPIGRVAITTEDEFVMLLARREPGGGVAVLATLPAEPRLVESIARTL